MNARSRTGAMWVSMLIALGFLAGAGSCVKQPHFRTAQADRAKEGADDLARATAAATSAVTESDKARAAESLRVAAAQAEKERIDQEATKQFQGLNLGIGLTLTIDAGGKNRIEDAEVAGNLVRVKKERNSIPRLMLEGHYFFMPAYRFLGQDPEKWGLGPFVAIQSSNDEVIDSFGFGVLCGFRRELNSNSFNLGVGAVLDPDVKTLGEGIRENRPLPAGETEVRFKEESQWGYLIAASFSF